MINSDTDDKVLKQTISFLFALNALILLMAPHKFKVNYFEGSCFFIICTFFESMSLLFNVKMISLIVEILTFHMRNNSICVILSCTRQSIEISVLFTYSLILLILVSGGQEHISFLSIVTLVADQWKRLNSPHHSLSFLFFSYWRFNEINKSNAFIHYNCRVQLVHSLQWTSSLMITCVIQFVSLLRLHLVVMQSIPLQCYLPPKKIFTVHSVHWLADLWFSPIYHKCTNWISVSVLYNQNANINWIFNWNSTIGKLCY